MTTERRDERPSPGGGAAHSVAIAGVVLVAAACAGNLGIWFVSFGISRGGGALMGPSVVRDVLGSLLVLAAAIRLLRIAARRRAAGSPRPGAPAGDDPADGVRADTVRAILVGVLGIAVSVGLGIAMGLLMPDLYQRGLLFTPVLFVVGVVPAAALLLRRVDSTS